jgi:hypothetical protein
MFIRRYFMLHAADTGTEGAADETQKQTGDATGQNGGDAKPFAVYTTEAEFQAAIEAKLKARLERADEKAKQLADKAARDAKAKALTDNAQFEELSKQQAAQLAKLEADYADTQAKLEALTGDAGKYRTALDANVKARREGLPGHIIALLDNLDPVQQLDWLTKNAALLGANVGIPATPKSEGKGGDIVTSFLQEQAERDKARKNPLLKG